MTRILFTAAIGGTLWFSICNLLVAQQVSSERPVSIVPRSRPRPSEAVSVPQIDLRVDSSLVLIPAQVTSPLGTAVTGLTAENFRLLEDRVEQKIASFSHEDEPVSVGLVFDASGSMGNKIHESAAAAAAFFKTAGSGDEFFLVEFGERPKLAVPFTPDSDQIYRKIARSHPFGRTSLIDALHLAVAHMKNARNRRKAIVILSDGGDNHSRFTLLEIRNTLLESDVQVYAMGLFNRDLKRTEEEARGPELLRNLAEQTGGRAYPVDKLDDLASISTTIGNQLRSRYLLGYVPPASVHDGKYRRVTLLLTAPAEMPGLRVDYRRGYYAPTE
jgi:Ca-activated chloride channel homolog